MLKRLFRGLSRQAGADHAQPTQPPITIVSGLPRSGTSLMMRMLEAGGIPPLTDHERTADEDNPGGYYEFERVKRLEKGDTVWLATTTGKAVKVISVLLRHLPPTYQYRVIFMERDLGEVLASQRKMLVNRQEESADVDDAQMAALFARHLQEIRHWLSTQSNMTVLYVSYSDLLAAPTPLVSAVNSFLGGTLNTSAMLTVIDPTLYRNRQES
jgi:hypothetical protein